VSKIIISSIILFTYLVLLSFFPSFGRHIDIVFIPIVMIVVLVIVSLIRSKKRRTEEGVIGVFAKKKEKVKEFFFQTKSGFILVDNPFRGILVSGGAGSGKSLSIFEPIIRQIAEKGYTGILYDFKSPELTHKLLESYRIKSPNIETYFVDFKEPNISNRLNPIAAKYLLKSAFALEYATTLINNLLPQTIKERDFFSDNARMVLAGVIWYLRNKHPNFCSLPHVISLLLHNDIDKLINQISEDYEAGGMVASLKQAIDRGAEKQAAAVASTLQNAVSQLNTPEIFYILSGNDFDLHLNDSENPKFLCIGNDSTLSQTYAPVISLIISVAVRQMNVPNKEKSIILLDEAPTIYIPNIEQIPATGRSNKIATVFGIQDYSQLVDKYGQEKAQVILSNLGNQFYGRTVNEKSAEMIVKLFGKYDKTYKTNSEGSGSSGEFVHLSSNNNKSINESIQEREKIKLSEIINLETGQFCGLIAEGKPREFIRSQFIASETKSDYQIRSRVSNNKMILNYNKIVNESKQILYATDTE